MFTNTFKLYLFISTLRQQSAWILTFIIQKIVDSEVNCATGPLNDINNRTSHGI